MKKDRKILNIEIPAYWILVVSLIFFVLIKSVFIESKSAEIPSLISKEKCKAPLTILRESDYKLIRPLLIADMKGEDKKFNSLKDKVSHYIEVNKKSSSLTSASVYFSELNDGSHFGINQEQQFLITRLLRIGKIIALMKQGEIDPSFLNKQIIYKGSSIPSSTGMIVNQSYSVKDLINRLVANDDDCVKDLLNPLVDMKIYQSVYEAIQNQFPGLPSKNYKMNACDYSKFLKLFYNAGYLSISDSEFMLQLLTHSNFKNGITKYLDNSVKVSHFFSINEEGSSKQVHEFGIIYLNNKPYLLGIMTDGNNIEKQSAVIAEISKMVYDEMIKTI